MKKEAILLESATALAFHALQNLSADELLLKNKKISKKLGVHLARAFKNGTAGSKATLHGATAFLSGGLLPEVHAMTQKANELGHKLGPNLSARQIVALHKISTGNLDHGVRLLKKEHGPAAEHLLNAMHLKGTELMNASKESLHEAGEHIKKSPFLNPIRSALSKQTVRDVSKEVHHTTRFGASSALLGSGASALLEPIAGTVNAVKSTYVHPILSKIPGVSHVNAGISKYYKHVFKHAARVGSEGKKTALRSLQRYGLNAVAQRGEDLTNDVSRALASKPFPNK